MDLNSLSSRDRAILGQALRAAADGPFFPDWEFHTLFGLQRSEVRAIANAWPNPAASSQDVELAVNNSLGNLLGYPHGQDAVWSQWISVDTQQLTDLFSRLRTDAESLSPTAETEVLARIAFELTICARNTYEVGTENVLEPRVLRAYNELLHRVTGAVVSQMLAADEYSFESILEMIRKFGAQHNRVKEIEWVLNRALRKGK